MTRKAYQHLKKRMDEIARLTGKGGELTKEIGKAASFGDLSENAEWVMAREHRDRLLTEAESIRGRLSAVEFIDDWKVDTDKVRVGTRVTLLDLNTSEERVFQILGSDDTPFYDGAISASSPIARGLLGKAEGDEVEVEVPAGTRNFEILSIEWFSESPAGSKQR
ncbi:MAG: GreA/GreB family elongation factor [Candidatus Schekmanbacteria bacterium]|nr:GreA/GreB family elongation factor [Candidatus Schekmanbacteria bacterium]